MITLIALLRLTAMEAKQRNQKKGILMNPFTQLKKIRILRVLIAPALVAFNNNVPVQNAVSLPRFTCGPPTVTVTNAVSIAQQVSRTIT